MPPKSKKSEISQVDCPSTVASQYPGKFSKDNPNGSVLNKHEFIESAVRDWVKHFDESDKYENTTMAHKVMYLEHHLCKFKTRRFGTKQTVKC